jgi:hypothetical protein
MASKQGTVLAFPQRHEENHNRTSVRIADNITEIQTEHLKNARLQHHCYDLLSRWSYYTLEHEQVRCWAVGDSESSLQMTTSEPILVYKA